MALVASPLVVGPFYSLRVLRVCILLRRMQCIHDYAQFVFCLGPCVFGSCFRGFGCPLLCPDNRRFFGVPMTSSFHLYCRVVILRGSSRCCMVRGRGTGLWWRHRWWYVHSIGLRTCAPCLHIAASNAMYSRLRAVCLLSRTLCVWIVFSGI